MPAATHLRLRSGERRLMELGPGGQIELYTELVHGGQSGLIELVPAERLAGPSGLKGGKLRMFSRREPGNYLPAGDRRALRERALGFANEGFEVFATPAILVAAEPGNDSVGPSGCVWVDIDTARGVDALRRFGHPPHMVVRSGSGGLHAYWRLAAPVRPDWIEAANRALCAHLGADPQSTNRGRIMRLPGTRNHKAGREAAVATANLAMAGYELAELCAGLEDPKRGERAKASRRGATAPSAPEHSELDLIAPPLYWRALTGEPVDERGELVRCPNPGHEDRHPSCKVYANPGEGWHCFSCGAGGNAPDLESALGGGPTGAALRGEAFTAARCEAERALGIETHRQKEIA
jgi:hypothetical protein